MPGVAKNGKVIHGPATHPDLTAWARAVTELLQSAGISEAKLAKHVGVNRGLVSMHLRLKRKPSPDLVKRYTEGVAAVVSSSEPDDFGETKRDAAMDDDEMIATDDDALRWDVEDYLRELAGRPSIRYTDELLAGSVWGLSRMQIIKYLKVGALQELDRLIRQWPSARQRRFASALRADRARHMIAQLSGAPPPTASLFDDASAVCRRYGIDLEQWLDKGPVVQYHRSVDSVALVVHATLAEAMSDDVCQLPFPQRMKVQRRLVRTALASIQAQRTAHSSAFPERSINDFAKLSIGARRSRSLNVEPAEWEDYDK